MRMKHCHCASYCTLYVVRFFVLCRPSFYNEKRPVCWVSCLMSNIFLFQVSSKSSNYCYLAKAFLRLMPEFTDLDCVQKKLMLHQFYLDHLILACVFPTKGKPKIPSKNHCKLFSVLENCCLIFQPCRFFKSSFLAFTIFCFADKLRGKPNIFTFQTLSCEIKKETKEFLYVFFDDCALQEVFINFL